MLKRVFGKLESKEEATPDYITIVDHASGEQISIALGPDRTLDASALQRAFGDKNGILVYDPGYQNTAVVKSSISFIDGERGILRYRGIPIEKLAEKSSFLEVAYLLIYGHLPSKGQLGDWQSKVMQHTFVHNNLTHLMSAFNYDAHPMGMFIR